MMRWLIGGIVGLLVVFAAAVIIDAHAAAPAPGAKAALTITDQFIVPRYKALAAAADANVNAWKACGPKADAALKAAYNTLADHWAEVELVKNGPILLFLRAERFNYWPEARNATDRDLAALLATSDPKTWDPLKLTRDDIPAQGLPAIERLLYDAQYTSNPGRCRVGQGIAGNLARIAHDVLAEWTAPDGVRAAIAANKGWNNNLFANANEAAGMFLTDLVGAFTFMNDQKLLAAMSSSAVVAKPKLAEAWRSGRSQRNLALNIAAIAEFIRLFEKDIPPAGQQKLNASAAAAQAAIQPVPADIGAAAGDAKAREKLVAARAALKAAQAAVIAVIPAALNVSMGFNSLDGD